MKVSFEKILKAVARDGVVKEVIALSKLPENKGIRLRACSDGRGLLTRIFGEYVDVGCSSTGFAVIDGSVVFDWRGVECFRFMSRDRSVTVSVYESWINLEVGLSDKKGRLSTAGEGAGSFLSVVLEALEPYKGS